MKIEFRQYSALTRESSLTASATSKTDYTEEEILAALIKACAHFGKELEVTIPVDAPLKISEEYAVYVSPENEVLITNKNYQFPNSSSLKLVRKEKGYEIRESYYGGIEEDVYAVAYEKTCDKYIYAIADDKEIKLGTTNAVTRKDIIEEIKNNIRKKDFDDKEELIPMLSLSEKTNLTFDVSAESEDQACDIHVDDYNYAFIEFENLTCKGKFYKQIRR